MATARATSPRQQRTQTEWLARAVELAERHGMTYRTKYLGRNAEGYEVFTAPSERNANVVYAQFVNPVTHQVHCRCQAGVNGQPCKHAGASWHHWSQIAEAMSEAGARANEQYQAFAAWLASRGY